MNAAGLGRISQIALHVSDVDRAERFYRDTPGLPLPLRFGDLAFSDCAGVRLIRDGGHEPRGAGHAAFCIDLRTAGVEATAATRRRTALVQERRPATAA